VDRLVDQIKQKAAKPLFATSPIGEGGIRTHGTVTRTTVFEFYDSHAVLCRAVANCALWFGIFIATIPSCDAPCHSVLRSWFCNLVCKFLSKHKFCWAMRGLTGGGKPPEPAI